MKIKFLLLFCFLFISMSCFACKKEYYELDELALEVIFDQEEDEYLIFMHKDGCSGCETVLPEIMKYNTEAIDNGLEKPKVYALNLEPEGEKNLLIYRAYKKTEDGEDGQGTDGKYFVDNVTRWGDLYIATTPSIILIKNVDGVKTAFYKAQGVEAIKAYLKGL